MTTNDATIAALVASTASLEYREIPDAVASRATENEARDFWEWALACEGAAFKGAALALVRTGDDSGIRALAAQYLNR